MRTSALTAEKDGKIFQVVIEQIEFIESIDEQTWLYIKNERYRCEKKLYELEKMLKMMSFVRISKSCIVNSKQLQQVNPLFDGKFEALTTRSVTLLLPDLFPFSS